MDADSPEPGIVTAFNANTWPRQLITTAGCCVIGGSGGSLDAVEQLGQVVINPTSIEFAGEGNTHKLTK